MTDDLRELSGQVSIVGVGDTDYGADWRASKAKTRTGPGAIPTAWLSWLSSGR